MVKIKTMAQLPIKEIKCKDVYGTEYTIPLTDAPKEKTWDDAMDSMYNIMLNEWSKEEIIEYTQMTAKEDNDGHELFEQKPSDAERMRTAPRQHTVRGREMLVVYEPREEDEVADKSGKDVYDKPS